VEPYDDIVARFQGVAFELTVPSLVENGHALYLFTGHTTASCIACSISSFLLGLGASALSWDPHVGAVVQSWRSPALATEAEGPVRLVSGAGGRSSRTRPSVASTMRSFMTLPFGHQELATIPPVLRGRACDSDLRRRP